MQRANLVAPIGALRRLLWSRRRVGYILLLVLPLAARGGAQEGQVSLSIYGGVSTNVESCGASCYIHTHPITVTLNTESGKKVLGPFDGQTPPIRAPRGYYKFNFFESCVKSCGDLRSGGPITCGSTTIQSGFPAEVLAGVLAQGCTAAAAATAEPPYSCTDGGSDESVKDLEDPLRDALRSSGFEPRVDSVYVYKNNGMTCFQIRLGKNHQPLPSLACIERRIRSGEVKEGSVDGATTMLVGCIQQDGNRTRTTVREIDVETAEVLPTGKGDAQGTDMPAIGKSVKEAFRNMAGAGRIF